MTHEQINKLMEIQYLKGRLDELYKSYTPGQPSHTNRVVDARISKYEMKLKELDEVVYHLYQVERTNVRFSKQKSKKIIKNLLEETLSEIQNDTLKEKIENQLNTYN